MNTISTPTLHVDGAHHNRPRTRPSTSAIKWRPCKCNELVVEARDDCLNCIIHDRLNADEHVSSALEKSTERIEVHRLRPLSTLYEAGAKGDAVFAVRSGMIKLVHHLHNGDYRIVRLLRSGDMAGLNSLLGEAHKQTAIAINHAEVCRIPVEALTRSYTDHRELCKGLMQRWQKTLNDADTFVGELCTGCAESRVARLLLHLDTSGEAATIPRISREDMGAMLGISRETASRVMADFRRRRLIERSGSDAYSFDRKRLFEVTRDL